MKKRMYATYRRTYAFKQRLFSQLTAQGRFLIVFMIFCMIVGSNTRQTVIYQISAILFTLFLVSRITNLRFKASFSITRIMPKSGIVGEPLRYRIVVENTLKNSENGLLWQEEHVDPRPTLNEFLSSREPKEYKRNSFDRSFGYYRWLWLIKKNIGALFPISFLPDCMYGHPESIDATFVPERRGYIRLHGIRVMRPDIFNVTVRSIIFSAPVSVLVLPRIYPVPAFTTHGMRKYQEGETALIRKVGDSEEFLSIREYQPGDPLKKIHWKSFAKLGKPMVKETQDQFASRYALILDTFSAQGEDEVFEDAVTVAASFVASPHEPDSLLDLLFVGPKAYCLTCGRGTADYMYLMEILACVRPTYDTGFSSLYSHVVQHINNVSGCILVLLTLDDDRITLIRAIVGRGIPLEIYLCTDKRSSSEILLSNYHIGVPVKILEHSSLQEGLLS